MSMIKTVAMDIETDGLNPSRIWVICAEDVDTGERNQFLNVTTIQEERERFIEYCMGVDKFVFHNGIGFDVPVINRLLGGEVINLNQVVDTLIMSRLIDYNVKPYVKGTNKQHSLKAWGIRLNAYKGDFSDFSKLTQKMIDYCVQDVVITVKLYNKFRHVIEDPEWIDSIWCEHQIQMVCETMSAHGFYFDKDKAEVLLDEIQERMASLESKFQEDFPPELKEVKRLKYRKKADGTLYSYVTRAQQEYPKTVVDWSEDPPKLVCYDYVPFQPSSVPKRIDKLWELGWKPYEKTKGHMDYEREQKAKSW